MAASRKPTTPGRSVAKPAAVPATPFKGDPTGPLWLEGPWIWAPLRREWLLGRPEEIVRQEFIHRLHTSFGYALDQMAQERSTRVGRGSSRADIVVAENAQALADNRDYRIAVEAKAENVSIRPDDYGQGESYARAVGAEFLVLHNNKQTSFFRLVPGAPGERIEITSIPRAHELGDARRLEEIRRSTKTFTRDEFQRLLFECHSILRDNHKMDPGSAFDEISKILFIKMAFERMDRAEVFTTDRLNEIARASLIPDADDPRILEVLFETTKRYYRTDQLFSEGEALRVSMATFRRIVKLLERFNLSDTGDDVKGIAFERFLGQTFRGELGQFFTPRPIVDFMVAMLDPSEEELVCDPASGTGGFLIRTFEHLRSRIEADVELEKAAARRELEARAKAENWTDEQLVDAVAAAVAEANEQLDLAKQDSRLFQIAHNRIYGTDAEPRAARTSKMNMIMHGDGHGGIHYHDGLVDTNGIFPGRFDVVITNPPFGSAVGSDQLLGVTEQTRVMSDADEVREATRRYGQGWASSNATLRADAAARLPILALFDIGRDPIAGPRATSKVRPARATETLFVERCLSLLRPGGRLGIVLPDGILNNPSMAWLRDYVRGRAKLTAVVSLPPEVFASAKATVKTSLAFIRKFTDEEVAAFEAAGEESRQATADAFAERVTELAAAPAGRGRVLRAVTPAVTAARRQLRQEMAAYERSLLDAKVSYPVFMADVAVAGITATGDTGADVPNELPLVLEEFRRFEADPDAYVAASVAALRGHTEEQAGAT